MDSGILSRVLDDIREYGGRVIYRQALARRNWLDGEVVLGYSWPREKLEELHSLSPHVPMVSSFINARSLFHQGRGAPPPRLSLRASRCATAHGCAPSTSRSATRFARPPLGLTAPSTIAFMGLVYPNPARRRRRPELLPRSPPAPDAPEPKAHRKAAGPEPAAPRRARAHIQPPDSARSRSRSPRSRERNPPRRTARRRLSRRDRERRVPERRTPGTTRPCELPLLRRLPLEG